MFVRLGFAVAANVEPEVLLIDEVLSVGDESFQRKCAEKIEQFRQRRSHDRVREPRARPGRAALRGRRLDRQGRAARGRAVRPTSSPSTRARATTPGGSRVSRVPAGGAGEGQIVHVELLDGEGEPQTRADARSSRSRSASSSRRTRRSRTSSSASASTPSTGEPVWGSNTRRTGRTIGRLDGPARVELVDRQPAAARGCLRPVGRAHRPHRDAPVRPLGAADPLRGPSVPVVRRRAGPHPWQSGRSPGRSRSSRATSSPVKRVRPSTGAPQGAPARARARRNPSSTAHGSAAGHRSRCPARRCRSPGRRGGRRARGRARTAVEQR